MAGPEHARIDVILVLDVAQRARRDGIAGVAGIARAGRDGHGVGHGSAAAVGSTLVVWGRDEAGGHALLGSSRLIVGVHHHHWLI